MQEIRDSGERTPQIAFFAHAGGAGIVKKIYNEFYAKKLFPELWFYWKVKPLILSPFKGLDKKLLDFLTVRYFWAWSYFPMFGDDPAPWLVMEKTDGHGLIIIRNIMAGTKIQM